MSYTDTKKAFRPVRCLESDIETLEPVEGYVLFTTDTNKIYVCIDGEYKLTGGSSGVFYGNRSLTDDEKYGDSLILIFTRDQIEGKQTPNVDDLILNIPDGGFYRITDIDEENITATKIAVSGSGGGGSGGVDSNQGSVQINLITPAQSSVISGKDYYIEFEVVAKDSAGDPVINDGIGTWRINGKEIGTQVIKNGENKFKVSDYLDSSKDTNKIILVLSIDTGGSTNTIISKTWNVKAIELGLKWEWDYTVDSYINSDRYRIQFYPSGRINCTAHYRADDGSYITQDISAADANGGVFNSIEMNSLSYGAHTLEIWLSAEVNGETFETDHIKNELTFIYGAEEGIILTVPYYQTTAMQYESLNIPFLVYDPKNTEVEVSFKVNGNVETITSYNRDIHYWPYSIKEVGVQSLEIDAGAGASKLFEISVTPLELNTNAPTDYMFSLKAADFSGNSQIQEWQTDSGIKLIFSDNFDWERGGLQTETLSDGSIQKYICVRQGTTMAINYKLFGGTDPKTNGRSFKFCFKTANVYDYEASVLNCYSESDKIGLRVSAQEAIFSTPSHPSFSTQYYENTYLELEAEVWKNVSDKDNLPGDRFIMFWLDGVPVGVKAYPTNEIFRQTSDAKDIVIGSELCDVYVYLIKAYDYRLTENQHIDNFIMDAPNSTEMIARYNRNNILDNSGEISYEKLVQNNPGCRAYVYEMDHMTTSKSDKVDGCKYFELYGNYNTEDNPYYKTDNAQVYVQGTSSAAYGVAAFNLRTKFKDLKDAAGEEVEGWKPSETALPVNLACTKVNIASCENANNAVNVDWYNKFQPYHDKHRRKGSQYRDCMEFNTGVVFVKDNNQTTEYYNSEGKPDKAEYLKANAFLDTSGYTSKPYYKMYAIGNMGNDKKNSEIFHDTDNPKTCCLEVRDNQNKTHWMTTSITLETVDEKDAEGSIINYEFRYPDGNDKASTEQKQAWVDFVNWMAKNNPKGATNKPLKAEEVSVNAVNYKSNYYFLKNDEGQYYKDDKGSYDSNVTYYDLTTGTDEDSVKVIFGNYTFKGFEPVDAPEDPNPSGVSLKGTIITDYSTTKVIKQMKLDSKGDPILEGNEEDGYEYVWEDVSTVVPYTTDSYEYRMARMLSECEDHLVMDSIVYHYLFVERHTMVDNIAKNAFWSTEDLFHWDLTRNYDNDTLDGNDNSGFLSFSYGIEVYDKKKNADGSDGDAVFNAENSVWLAFVNGLPEARSSLYKQLQIKGAWNAKEYLAEFNKVQSIIPERCWIADYIRKYIRPRRLGLDVEGSYLERLEGGKKTAQREQYETYNEYYQNSKYIAGAQFTPSSSIDMRLNAKEGTPWDANHVIPITYYIDCYGSGLFGGRATQSSRLKRGEVYECPIGQLLSNPHDATSYIYGANMIQTLGGIAEVYPSYAIFSTASKLREIELGSDQEGYQNQYLKTVGINANEMLQKALLQNVGQPEGLSNELDLTKAVQLTELRLNGSTAKSLTLADGGIIEILYLNGLSTLSMSNLSKLKDVKVDEDIYTNMTNLTVKKCPGFDDISYLLALKAPLLKYEITDFSWKITETNENNFDIQEGKVVGLKVLDKLSKLAIEKTALAGTIIIDTDCEIDEYSIYEKYIQKFPNVVIEYTNKVNGLVSAIELKFLTEKDSSDIYYRVLAQSNNEKALSVLTSAEGPTGVALAKPSNKVTLVNTQKFNGYWVAENGNKYYREEDLEVKPESDTINFADFIPTESQIFYPDVTYSVTEHAVKFFDINNELVQTDMIPYGELYNGSMINYLYADDTSLGEEKRYTFKGWTITKYEVGKGKNIDFIDLTNYIVKGPVSLYPYYEIEDITKVSSEPSYFEYEESKDYSADTSTLIIRLKENVPLQGKVSIPNPLEVNSKLNLANYDYITFDFMNMDFKDKVNLVYFKLDSPYSNIKKTGETINGEPCASLKKIYFPSKLTTIERNTFSRCVNLNFDNLPTNLTYIETGAFYHCISLTLDSLPEAITHLDTSAFQECSKLAIEKFDYTLSSFGTFVFNEAGKDITSVYFTNNFLNAIKDLTITDAFLKYGSDSSATFYFENIDLDLDSCQIIAGKLGLSGRHCSYWSEKESSEV